MQPHSSSSYIPESCRTNCLKFIYLNGAILITVTLIIELILLHLVIKPYLHESDFTSTSCYYINSQLIDAAVVCENKCSKDQSKFPCLKIRVRYVSQGVNHSVVLFDNIATYEHYKSRGCATSSCHHRDTDNAAWVDAFEQRVKSQGRFSCFIHTKHEEEALLNKFYSESALFHSLFWPIALFLAASVCVALAYYVDRCNVWTGDRNVIV